MRRIRALVENDPREHDWPPPGRWVPRPLQAPGDVQEVAVWAAVMARRLQTHGRAALICRWNQGTSVAAGVPGAHPPTAGAPSGLAGQKRRRNSSREHSGCVRHCLHVPCYHPQACSAQASLLGPKHRFRNQIPAPIPPWTRARPGPHSTALPGFP